MKLSELPLGTRFKYQATSGNQFILLDKSGHGIIAPWKGLDGNALNAMYAAAACEEEFRNIEVFDPN